MQLSNHLDDNIQHLKSIFPILNLTVLLNFEYVVFELSLLYVFIFRLYFSPISSLSI